MILALCPIHSHMCTCTHMYVCIHMHARRELVPDPPTLAWFSCRVQTLSSQPEWRQLLPVRMAVTHPYRSRYAPPIPGYLESIFNSLEEKKGYSVVRVF